MKNVPMKSKNPIKSRIVTLRVTERVFKAIKKANVDVSQVCRNALEKALSKINSTN
jgi:hypothetical protein